MPRAIEFPLFQEAVILCEEYTQVKKHGSNVDVRFTSYDYFYVLLWQNIGCVVWQGLSTQRAGTSVRLHCDDPVNITNVTLMYLYICIKQYSLYVFQKSLECQRKKKKKESIICPYISFWWLVTFTVKNVRKCKEQSYFVKLWFLSCLCEAA